MDQPLLTRDRSALPAQAEGLNAYVGEDGVAVLEFARPHRRNAVTLAVWQALPKVLDQLAEQDGVRALLLTGAGNTFSAGADITELAEVYGDPQRADAYHAVNVAAEEALAAFPHPTLAVVHGACVGGGCQLAVACDLRFVAEDARLGITPAKLGVVYPAVPTLRLARLVGPARAKYLLFSGELVRGRDALPLGLAERVLPDAELDAAALEFARLLTRRSTQTIGAVKAALAVPAERAAEALAPWERRSREASDVHEGLAAFLDGRPPRF
ncbi:enoyl-CoA hydratase/isomerase family protein [Kitasatospora aureofaciens]|uniref:Enoyl-CoA hydratase n=1 Tax=Kitasatospora aureofaciens TaxID=1894 RepID=A0A8H9HT84_KITAU|nr:enoyl-CoA hydratase/isomerase family protein [Kitasatospora aureofaciens]ARF78398.1 enoyl-CoA hydratase [Kitasatospora aureofaciens]QEU99611.1 enoyl-CoA hydratase/isomerase family protein [Streptomyces viridifaciens]UKZ05716.1 enoyl-CoA hydratase/isomerase family protein [Streptomyces viridifaciens]GGU79505.1 enoyl-CoA hydratase [Kitasatospora aureofaciens]